MEWKDAKVSLKPHENGLLVSDGKVVAGESCYVAKGWSLPRDEAEISRFVDACISRGFVWALQDGHPSTARRGAAAEPLTYLYFSRHYDPQPSWDIGANNPSGQWHVVEKRHEACLLAHGIGYKWEKGGGNNLLIWRTDLERALDAITVEQREEEAEKKIRRDGATDKEALIKARRGQGKFRERVLANEPSCRLTGVSDARFLRASHIKPWIDSTDVERLDGDNGLMLAPHVDHLFDLGFISFEQSGELLVAEGVRTILEVWHLPSKAIGKEFNDNQERYLKYHRQNVFR